jgi:hypothetical protein
VEQLKQVMDMMFEMIWLTNNFIAHQGYNKDNVLYQEVAISAGLHDTYFKIIEKFSAYENQLGAQILSDELWSNIVWGVSAMAIGLKSCAFLKSDFLLTKKANSNDQN